MSKAIPISIIVGIVFVLAIIGVGVYFGITTQSMISFQNQCSLASCPSGYTDTGTICDNLHLECTRTCIKETGGHCGAYGSEQAKGDIHSMNANTKNRWFISPYGPVESTSKCYKYRTATIFTITDRDPCSWSSNSESHEVYTKDSTSKTQPNMDYSSGNSVSSGSLWSVGKLGDGSKNRALGKYIPYKGAIPKAGDDACGSKGELSVYLFYKTASWVKDYDTKIIKCHYECNRDADCGNKQAVGERYCSGDKIVQDYSVPDCKNYMCEDKKTTETIETCSDTCKNAICVEVQDTGFFEDLFGDDEIIEEEIIIIGEDENIEESNGDTGDSQEQENLFLDEGKPTFILFSLIGLGILLFILFMVIIMVLISRRKHE